MDTRPTWLPLLLLTLLALTSASLHASDARKERQSLTGTLVDITCVTDPKRNLTKLRSEHTRKCLLMPICAESGYALLTDRDEVLRFDAKGNESAQKLIEKHSHTQRWRVSVEGTVQGDQLTVERIRLL
jgi:hypothetical protein